MEEGLSQARQYYDDLLSSQKTEVAMKYKEEKTQMSREIQQLEERVAILMQQQQHQQNVENIISLSSHLQGAVIKDGGGTCVQIDLDRLREVLQATMIAVKNDVAALVRTIWCTEIHMIKSTHICAHIHTHTHVDACPCTAMRGPKIKRSTAPKTVGTRTRVHSQRVETVLPTVSASAGQCKWTQTTPTFKRHIA